MSFTTLDQAIEEQSNHILASAEALRQLTGVPAGFRLAGMMLLRAKKGTIRFDLPDGRRVLFDHGQKGPNAVVEVHSFDFAKRAIAGGDVGFASIDPVSVNDLSAMLLSRIFLGVWIGRRKQDVSRSGPDTEPPRNRSGLIRLF